VTVLGRDVVRCRTAVLGRATGWPASANAPSISEASDDRRLDLAHGR
jgi:hypothetical protein